MDCCEVKYSEDYLGTHDVLNILEIQLVNFGS